jgi:hypothetical protein
MGFAGNDTDSDPDSGRAANICHTARDGTGEGTEDSNDFSPVDPSGRPGRPLSLHFFHCQLGPPKHTMTTLFQASSVQTKTVETCRATTRLIGTPGEPQLCGWMDMDLKGWTNMPMDKGLSRPLSASPIIHHR